MNTSDQLAADKVVNFCSLPLVSIIFVRPPAYSLHPGIFLFFFKMKKNEKKKKKPRVNNIPLLNFHYQCIQISKIDKKQKIYLLT